MLMYKEEDRISWDDIIKHPILSESVSMIIMEDNHENQEDEVHNSIIKNR